MGRISRRQAARKPLKHDEVPRALRHDLWTLVYTILKHYADHEQLFWSSGSSGAETDWLNGFWTEALELPLSSRFPGEFHPAGLQEWFYETATWSEVYDAVDYIVANEPRSPILRFNQGRPVQTTLAQDINGVLRAHQAPWMVMDRELAALPVGEESAEVNAALEQAPDLVRIHLDRALGALSLRPDPEVHRAITESIQAVECMAKHLIDTQQGTYPKLVQSLKKRGVHPAFAHAFDGLYGYTSDAGGLRHSFKPGQDPTKHVAEGRLFVIMASAYINYMREFYSAPLSEEEAQAVGEGVTKSAKP